MAIKPLGDRVVVEPKEEGEEKVGSLYIPDTAKEKPQEGKVVAVGDGKGGEKPIEIVVKVGDRILYGKYSGTEVKEEGKEYLIIRQSDILGIIT
jgi:chaperonin GroES